MRLIPGPRALATALAVLALACQAQQVDIRTDRRSYSIAPADSLAAVQLTVRNRGSHPIYLQTVDGRIDLLVLIRVDANGRILVGADTAGDEKWSLFQRSSYSSPPKMGVLPVGPDSVVTNTYSLPRGHYRMLVKYGDAPEKLEENGEWVERFSIQ
jgi:hypothetical protein